MRINHKSDFDFRLDLYAADPYGTAVAAGFPDCDFTGKLFIGPSARSRQCYTFSKSGSKLVNCFDNGGHLHVVVSGHNLASGPLYCELTIRVADSHYPGGFRSAVYSFPLNLYLTDNDAELISPTVSVTLPVMQKVCWMPDPTEDGNDPFADDGTDNVVPPNQANSCLSAPWLSPRVCGGHFRTGAYAGNIYRNDKGMIFLSGDKDGSTNLQQVLSVHIPTLMKLGIKDLTVENLVSKIKISAGAGINYTHSIQGDCLKLTYDGPNFPGYYLEIKKSPYVTITPDGSLKYLSQCPTLDYKPSPVTLQELGKHANAIGATSSMQLKLYFGNTFLLQRWSLKKQNRFYDDKRHRFTIFYAAKNRAYYWKTKRRIEERADVRPLFFRVARKKNGAVSDWLYFKALHGGHYQKIRLIQTDETGASMTANFIEL